MFGVTALALAGGEENIIQPNASLFLVFVLFIIFVFVLNRLLFRPIGRVLDEREALTEGATNEARAAARRYQTELASYEASIRQARGDSYRRLEQERAAALEERKRLIDEAKQKAAEEIDLAKSEDRPARLLRPAPPSMLNHDRSRANFAHRARSQRGRWRRLTTKLHYILAMLFQSHPEPGCYRTRTCGG